MRAYRGGVTRDPQALADELPDTAEQVETRWLLRRGGSRLFSDGGGAVVVADGLTSAAAVGDPSPQLVHQALAQAPVGTDLIVQAAVGDRLGEALEGWRLEHATVQLLERPADPEPVEAPGVFVTSTPGPELLAELPDEERTYAQAAWALSARRLHGGIVCCCQASTWSETLWDVGIDTWPGHRRRGHASACFRALAAYMAGEGRQPVWAAADGNAASLGMARGLGFVPTGRIAVLTPPG